MREARIALIGQPNTGKSTLFNVLTGGNEIVANWPGTTVEYHEGIVKYRDYRIRLIDLPGIYSLSYFTIEEKISRNYIVNEKPDLIVVLVDSLIPEKTLYLAVELAELTGKIIIAMTKSDLAHSRGIHINHKALSSKLGIPVLPVSAAKTQGIRELLEAIIKDIDTAREPIVIDYGELEEYINTIVVKLQALNYKSMYPLRWLAIKYLEEDPEIVKELRSLGEELYKEIEEVKKKAISALGNDLVVYLSKKRFEYIEAATSNTIIRTHLGRGESRFMGIFYNPYIAPVASIMILLSVFMVAFTINTGYPLNILFYQLGYVEVAELIEEYNIGSLLEKLVETLSNAVVEFFGDSLLARFISEGVINGVSILLLFTPLIAIVMALLGILEDTGILPRIAVGVHILLQKIGLSGHAIFPITMALGCNVPGILVTRANPNLNERNRLIMLLAFVPCQARLIVLLAIASVIGGFTGALIIPIAYIVSLLVLITLNYFLYMLDARRSTESRVELLLELPPVHKPIPKVVWWYTWYHLKHFLVKVGVVILVVNIVMWILLRIAPGLYLTSSIDESIIAQVSRYLTPLLEPLGITGEHAWILVLALMAGFMAKEIVLSALLIASGGLSLSELFNILELTPASTIAISIFIVLYIPCIATLLSIYWESKSLKTTVKTTILMLTVAYVTSIILYSVLKIIL